MPKGCLIADDVVIGPDAKLEPFERLSAKLVNSATENSDDSDSESDLEDIETSPCFYFLC